jgi:integrase
MTHAFKRGPTLRRHRRSGHGWARFNGHQVWFGPYGDHETRARFAAFKAEWEANGRLLLTRADQNGLTVADLVARFLEFAETYYRKLDGSPTGEVKNFRHAVRPLLALYGTVGVTEFDLRRLKLLREGMIDSGLCRNTVNKRVGHVVRIFGWGAEEEIVPPETYGTLRALKPLKRGRSRAPESDPVKPVGWKEVAAVLDHVSRQVRAMILLQWYTGARPGEIVQLRPQDVDRSGEVWVYRPLHHKTEHRGKERVIALGPKSQEVLTPFFLRVPSPAVDRPVFSPADAEAERRAVAREARRTPLWPSHERAQARKRRTKPKHEPGDRYTVGSYRRAIVRGCDAAKVAPWTPARLRHSAATRIRRELGLEAARVVLGHSSAAVTEIYAEVDQRQALEVAAKLG